MISYSNGQFLPTENVSIPIDDDIAGSIRGFRIFTTAIIVNGTVTFGAGHAERMIEGAKALNMHITLSSNDILEKVNETVAKNPECQTSTPAALKIILSGGKSGPRTPDMPQNPGLYILISPVSMPPAEYYKEGVSLATYPYQRDLAFTKLTYYVGSFIADGAVKAMNATFPLFTTPDAPERVLEGDTFNVFFVKNKTLYTPKAEGRILSGLTRRAAIKLAAPYYDVKETDIPVESFSSYDEAFLTSSIRKVMPVVRINKTQIGNGKPGKITQHLLELMTAEVGF
jgi:branched-subunit amino acid aminotransferase/4-amino-4-deoxychorismate lyase